MASQEPRNEEREPATGPRGLPAPGAGAPRITTVLGEDEIEALRRFDLAHRWGLSTAVRAILRERLLGEALPF